MTLFDSLSLKAQYQIQRLFWQFRSDACSSDEAWFVQACADLPARLEVSEKLFKSYFDRLDYLESCKGDMGGGAVVFAVENLLDWRGPTSEAFGMRPLGAFLPRGTFPIGFVNTGRALLEVRYIWTDGVRARLRELGIESLLHGGDLEAENHVDELLEKGFVEFDPFRWIEADDAIRLGLAN